MNNQSPRLAVTLLTFLASLACAPGVFAAPRIVCNSPAFDFGATANTGAVAHAFIVWNQGDSPLEINRVFSCCGATTQLDSKTIPPGTNTAVRVHFSLQGRHSTVKKAIYLSTNDPTNANFRLTLFGAATTPKPALAIPRDAPNRQ